MQWIGARSYSWYLWHWPLLALPRATFPENAYIEAIAVPASLAAACIAYSWLEMPLRNSRKLAAAPVLSLGMAAAAITLLVGATFAYLPALYALDRGIALRTARIEAAAQDNSRSRREGCTTREDEVHQPLCLYGDPAGHRRVVLMGDSHADHWFEAFHGGAMQAGWQLLAWAKLACAPVTTTLLRANHAFAACDQWREAALQRLTTTEKPDVVVLAVFTNRNRFYVFDTALGHALPAAESERAWKDGLRKTISRLIAAGVKVAVLRDTPRLDKDYHYCLLTRDDCTTPRARALGFAPVEVEVAREFGDRVAVLDLTDVFCDPAGCPSMRDGVMVYRDYHHLTATYSATLAPQVAAFLRSLDGTLTLPPRVGQSPSAQPTPSATGSIAR